MADKKKNTPFYITTTLPYVNADPHIGFAMEAVRADVIARRKKISGFEVFFNIGTDEHGAKIHNKAKEEGTDPQSFVDEKVKKFKGLVEVLNLLPETNFIRTTDGHHIESAKSFWNICQKRGFIYKKNYKIKYCVGCELEKTESELENGKCPLHPKQEIELIEEENYFFKFSSFGKELLDLYDKRKNFVVPETRFGEIKSFVKNGLEDFSISRLRSKMPWGIEVPDDPDHVMYVWFDALVNYISAVGWPDNQEKFKKWWVDSGGVIQYCGKDNLRQQAAMWQAMLMAADLPPSKQVIIDGFITGDGGVKMSKSLGNTVDPYDIVNEYGTDALRYFVLRELHPFEDSPFSVGRFKASYNANLANGLGNLVSRVVKMAKTNDVSLPGFLEREDPEEYVRSFVDFDLKKACDYVWGLIQTTDRRIQEKEPFKMVKTDPVAGKKEIEFLLSEVSFIGRLLLPILPDTSDKISQALKTKTLEHSLFPRK